MHDPIAYTYNADYHCPGCAENAYGKGADGYIGTDSVDSENNSIGAIAPWDEWQQFHGGCEFLSCGTCGGSIDSSHELACDYHWLDAPYDPSKCVTV